MATKAVVAHYRELSAFVRGNSEDLFEVISAELDEGVAAELAHGRLSAVYPHTYVVDGAVYVGVRRAALGDDTLTEVCAVANGAQN